MVEAKAGGEERNGRDEEDAVDIGHLNIYKLGCVGWKIGKTSRRVREPFKNVLADFAR